MIDASLFSINRNIFIILICAALGGCASTQRSSSASGGQAAAPISEAGTDAQGSGDAATKSFDPNAETTGSALPEAGKSVAASAPSSGTSSTGQPKTASASNGSAEEAQLKRQLAEQEAEISKLRTAQEAEAAHAQQQVQSQGGNSTSPGGKAATPVPASSEQGGKAESAASRRDDDIVAFPAGEKSGPATSAKALAPAPGADARSIFFDYDQSTIPKHYDNLLLQNAAYLKASPRVQFEVQGNCDERGSREYNLALGSRRAQAVKRALELAGADAGRIQVVSFGAEKPMANGKDEESYSKNRRVDIVY
jgi:peptidoglycan-associated lipoprotein